MSRSNYEQDDQLSVYNRANGEEFPGKLFHRLHLPKYMSTVIVDADSSKFGSNPHTKDPHIHQLPYMMMKHYGARGYARDRVVAHNLATHAMNDNIPSALEELTDLAHHNDQTFGGDANKDSIIEDLIHIFFKTLDENHKSGRYTITDAKFNALMGMFDLIMHNRQKMARRSYNLKDPNQFDLHDFYKINYLKGRSKKAEDYIMNSHPKVVDVDPVRDLHDDTPIIGNIPGGDETRVNPFFLFGDPTSTQSSEPLRPSRGFPSSRLHLTIPGASSLHNLEECLQ